MASSGTFPGSTPTKQQCSVALLDKLAGVLPKGYKFTVHHLSTPPTKTDALCSAPPGARPDRTYRESHFLAVSIDASAKPRDRSMPSSLPSSPLTPSSPSDNNPRQVLVLALEVFIFTTAWSSTFFVSKADSTGYLHLLDLPKGTPSPIREVSSAFISCLVEERRRNNAQTVVSLFARAQNQYLFPGSVDNKGKHVLDDRGLVRWWCRVLDSVMEGQGTHEDALFRPSRSKKGSWEEKKAYLVVPGLDNYESRAFLPRTPSAASNWSLCHPLERISHFAREYDWVPPRCLVPKFPDDPKARYCDELDLEASKSAQYEDKGLWRSVTTMDRFWEMMAFRQECSGGHMTGFLWLVLEPSGWGEANGVASAAESLLTPRTSFDGSVQLPVTPPRRREGIAATTPKSSPLKMEATPKSGQQSLSKGGSSAKPSKKTSLRGPIRSRLPRIKKHARNYVPNIPESTTYYYWPPEGRGTRIVAEADYKRSVDLLTKLDFETLELAVASSRRWTSEVGGGQKWALDVVGQRPLPPAANAPSGTVHDMAGLVRRKPKAHDTQNSVDSSALGLTTPPTRRTSAAADSDTSAVKVSRSETPAVNILGSGLVRKKPKLA
ncbi:hypothetical protein M406DRAFT_336780 [Cryphonectria parasitica EP155]|uniref:histone acetyltransferase n=1 Tax=Cryphonectria parasitica (strain ATCC 38755 / EP155) TaxID=660469 RepID=A0A9P4YDD9_CRYP1|nr:uncharacterized protein M406DRAFT_336780 [Cryphonectria parasitica EP155]KAF3771313.1 hypothetical protein M406DRAFT_336780 [Cryphonectria parasitica EP155]